MIVAVAAAAAVVIVVVVVHSIFYRLIPIYITGLGCGLCLVVTVYNSRSLTYAPCIVLQYVYRPTRCTNFCD